MHGGLQVSTVEPNIVLLESGGLRIMETFAAFAIDSDDCQPPH
jgi:hypothetical protein